MIPTTGFGVSSMASDCAVDDFLPSFAWFLAPLGTPSTAVVRAQCGGCQAGTWKEDALARYAAVVIPDEEDGGYVPAIPNCFTHGETREHAVATAEDAASPLLASFAAHGEGIPVEVHGATTRTIDVEAPVGAPA